MADRGPRGTRKCDGEPRGDRDLGGKLGPRERGEEKRRKRRRREEESEERKGLSLPGRRRKAKVSYAYNAGDLGSFGAFYLKDTVGNNCNGHSQER